MKHRGVGKFPLRTAELWLSAGLIAATVGCMGHVGQGGFVSFDDHVYVTENRHVQQGLCVESVVWALTSVEHANWHPLTWISLELDFTLYGLNPAGFHLTNLVLHVANTVLLFWSLRNMTGAVARSACVAALFAIHPLHVESVAWISERKDVLSTLFWMFSMLAYARYAAQPSLGRYSLVVVAFSLGLAAKAMLVTLPFVLLLLDFWPLRRGRNNGERRKEKGGHRLPTSDALAAHGGPGTTDAVARFPRATWLWLVIEKLPLIVLSAAVSAITLVAQSAGGALSSMERVPILHRASNAMCAYLTYLGKAVLPLELSPFYPLKAPVLGMACAAAAILLGITVWVCRRGRHQPYLAVGWFWYLGTLLPVIGLVQVGSQAIADRYTYIPLIGIFVVAVWGLADLAKYRVVSKRLVAVLASIALAGFALCTWVQVGYWRDSLALWERAFEVAGPSTTTSSSLGAALAERGRGREAEWFIDDALRRSPDDDKLRVNAALTWLQLGQTERSLDDFKQAVRLNPRNIRAQYNLGVLLELKQRPDEAVTHLSTVLELAPEHARAHLALYRIFAKRGDTEAAAKHFEAAARIDPRRVDDFRENHSLPLQSSDQPYQ